jgi:hypothetical protein
MIKLCLKKKLKRSFLEILRRFKRKNLNNILKNTELFFITHFSYLNSILYNDIV